MWKTNLSIVKKIFIVAFIFSFMIVTVGCSVKVQESTQNNGFTFTDDLGREITIAKNPKRVATLIGSFADVWLLAGGTVCATAEDAWNDFELELNGAVNIGGAHSPSFETLLSAEPDFVIASASTSSNVDMKEALENVGITVAYFDVDCFEDYLNMLNICTDITQRKDLYTKNGLDIQSKIESIKKEYSNKGISNKEKKVLLLRASSGFVKAKGSEGTILGEMLKDFGCVNIADNNKDLLENLSVESVIQQEPYHIFVTTMGDDTEKAMNNLTRMMEENPAWGTLGAVKENRLHIMDRKLFNIKPNADWAVSYEKLSEILLG